MILGCTATGELRRCSASTAINSEMAIRVAALMKAAITPARWYPKVLEWSAGARLEVHRGKAEQQGQEIGDVVSGLGQQRQ